MANVNNARKTFTDLNNPQQLRELNRQLEWVWSQLLGGLPAKALSAAGIKTVVNTVERTVASEIEADKITTNVLVAALAKMMVAQIAVAQIDYAQIVDANIEVANIAEAIIRDAKIESAQITDLTVQMLKTVTAEIEAADIAYAQIKDLAANQAIIEEGVGSSLLIKRLYVSAANMIGATIGQLVLKGEDGGYYELVIASDGTISTNNVTVTSGEIAAGVLGDGRQIVETYMNVRDLNAESLKANQATIASIFTAALTAGKITASEALIASAYIPTLYATSIQSIGDDLDLTANTSVNFLVGKYASMKNTVHRGDLPPSNPNAINDLWIQPVTNYTFQYVVESESIPEFWVDEYGFLYYSYGDDCEVHEFILDGGDLYMVENGLLIAVQDENGSLVWWERIKDSDLSAAEVKIQDDAIVATVRGSKQYLDDILALETSVNDVQTGTEQQIETVYSQMEQTADRFEVELGQKVGLDELRTYMRYEDGVLELGRSDSRYTTQTSDNGFVVLQDGAVMASMEQNTISAPVIHAQRMYTIGEHNIRLGATGHLIFN